MRKNQSVNNPIGAICHWRSLTPFYVLSKVVSGTGGVADILWNCISCWAQTLSLWSFVHSHPGTEKDITRLATRLKVQGKSRTAIIQKNICEVRYWWWWIRPGSQMVFQFIPKLFSRVEFRALCRALEFLHAKLVKPWLYGAGFEHRGTVILKQKKGFSKVLPRGCKSTIVYNVFV